MMKELFRGTVFDDELREAQLNAIRQKNFILTSYDLHLRCMALYGYVSGVS